MKTLCTLVATILLVSLLHLVPASNPDSEPVQDTSSDDNSNQTKSAPMRMGDVSQKKSTILERFPVLPNVWELRQTQSGRLRLVPWGGLGMLSYISQKRRISSSRMDMVVPTDDESSKGKTGSSNGSINTNIVSPAGESSRTPFVSPTENINASPVESGYSANFQPPNRPSDFRPFVNEQGDRRDQNGGPTFSNDQIPRDDFNLNPSSQVFGENESTSNTGSDRNSPQLPISSPNSSVFYANRDAFDRGENLSRKSPTHIPGNVPNAGRISPDSNIFASMINDFTFKLDEAINLNSNFIFSPPGIFLALSMLYLGSDGATKIELEQALGLDKNAVHGQRLHQGLKDLISSTFMPSSNYELYLANGLFLGKNVTVNKEFENDIHRFYGGEMKNLDFRNPQLSFPIINEWLSRSTRNMIPSISEGVASPSTRLLLLNAIYFKGIWKKQFKSNKTYEGQFFSLDGSIKTVPTMPMYGETFPFYRSEEYKTSFIKLPYVGDQLSMIIALPFQTGEKPMPGMNDRILCSVRDAFKDTKIDTVAIPKFRFEYIRSLRGALTKFGMSDLFHPFTVNLSKMRRENDIAVSDIVQMTVIDVNERGASASSSTAVKLVPLTYRNNTNFIVNHPFAFYIIHEPSGLVLFYGKINDIDQKGNVTPNTRRDWNSQRVTENTRPSDAGLRKNSRGRPHGAVVYRNERKYEKMD